MYIFPECRDVSGNRVVVPGQSASIGTSELAHILKKALQMYALRGTFRIL
jgi:hypothetical protein